jgi:hypothetical protein
VDVVLRTIRAVERRDARALLALYHPEVEMHHAPSLPYGGTRSGLNDIRQDIEHNSERTWLGTWGPLQPTQEERSIDPRVVAATDREVVVLYRQRALDPAGERFDAPVIGPYEVQSPSEIAYPLRAIFKRDRDVHVLLAEAFDFDLDARKVLLRPVGEIPAPASVPYDTLIVAGGSRYSYFGHDDWAFRHRCRPRPPARWSGWRDRPPRLGCGRDRRRIDHRRLG